MKNKRTKKNPKLNKRNPPLFSTFSVLPLVSFSIIHPLPDLFTLLLSLLSLCVFPSRNKNTNNPTSLSHRFLLRKKNNKNQTPFVSLTELSLGLSHRTFSRPLSQNSLSASHSSKHLLRLTVKLSTHSFYRPSPQKQLPPT